MPKKKIGAADWLAHFEKTTGGKLARGAVETTGAGHVARAAVDAHDKGIAKLVEKAREHGISEAKINAALHLKSRAEQVQNFAALLFPFIPSPAAIRALAGKT